jgi:hypothetical protein
MESMILEIGKVSLLHVPDARGFLVPTEVPVLSRISIPPWVLYSSEREMLSSVQLTSKEIVCHHHQKAYCSPAR